MMAMSVLVVTVLLLSVSEVISECPPSSGKTLDVYNNNCIGFIGIYLMHNGVCYPNGSYFFDSHIKTVTNNITCAMAGFNINNRKWTGPNGSNTTACPGSSSSGNLYCTNKSNGLELYIPGNYNLEPTEDGWYMCCLQAGCSDSIFANIFSKCTITHCHCY